MNFKQFLNEARYKKMKSATQLKVGDEILYGNEDTPHEVVSKAEQDGPGYWVSIKNLSTKKKERIYIDSGDTVPLNEFKLAKFAGYKKGDTLEFNGDYDSKSNKSEVLRGVVVNNTKGTEDVTVKLPNGKELTVKHAKVKGVVK